MDATHIISKMDYGSIVWIRIIPDNDEIQIRSIYETFKNGMRINPMHEANCIIESLTNFTEKQKHNTIKDATEFAESQMKCSNSCAIRYVLNRLTSNALWQQDDNGAVPALKNLIRIETAKNSIFEMLKKMNVKVSKEIQQPLASTLDEKLINNLKNHKFFKFKNLKQPEFLTTVIDMFTLVGRLQLTCYEYMRKRYSGIAMPNRPYIHRVLDMPLIALDFGNAIHKITDENFIQKRHGIYYYNLCTTVQEESFTTQNCCFLLIVDEINLDAILNCFLKWQKLGFLIGFLSGPPKTRFLSKGISNKNEKVFLHINSTFKCFGIALPSKDDIKAALPNSIEFFKGKCRCGNDETRIWICGDCNDFIYLGQGKKAYCKCGKYNFNRMGVKCFNEFHGTEYLYPERDNKFGALSLCLPSSLTSSSKRYLNDKVDECYEAVENPNWRIRII
uniref:Uncharacterized protein n=1 Tax=Panagrolaimus davidi TaxID=227884 RepID=A0A914PAA2_9BILA